MQFLIDISELIRNGVITIAALVGVYLAWKRLAPDTSRATATVDQAELARRAHGTELFNRAAGQLNEQQLEVRLAAIYVLRETSRDFPDLANPVFELLQAHLRERDAATDADNPPADVVAIVETLKSRIT